jgi:hypothetical protein
MNPLDVVRTRYYNQPYIAGNGKIYSSGIDAFKTIFRTYFIFITGTEGLTAFYKGFLTHFLRIGPHFCLTFVFIGMLKRNLQHFYNRLDLRDSFNNLHKDKNGYLSVPELKSVLESLFKSLDDPEYPIANRENISEYIDKLVKQLEKENNGLRFDEFQILENQIRSIFTEKNF